MKKILITLFVISMLAVSLGFVIADKPTKFDSNGVEIGWENSASTCTTIQDGILLNSDGEVITPGYDAWGYNYQAHLFNGRYCDYDRAIGGDYCDVELIMKWNDAWLSNVDCVGWDITGDWVLDFTYLGKLYIHDMTITDNSFEGTGAAQFSSQTWTVAGTIDGDNIEMTIDYGGLSYYVNVVGTIAQDGTMSGTWSNPSQSGTWESTSGAAVRTLDRHYGFESYIGSGAWLTNHQFGSYEEGGETCDWNYFVKIVAAPSDATLTDGIWYAADGTEIGPEIWGAFAIIQQVENDDCAGLHGLQYISPTRAGLGNW